MSDTVVRWQTILPLLEKRASGWRGWMPWNWCVRLPGGSLVGLRHFIRAVQALVELEREGKEEALLALQILCSGYGSNPRLIESSVDTLKQKRLVTPAGRMWFQFTVPSAVKRIAAQCLCSTDGYPSGMIDPWRALA